MRRLFGAIDWLNEWTGRIVGLQIVFIVGVVVYEVVMRSVFVRPTLWANETMVYVTAMAYLLGGGYTLLHRRHVIVDVIYQRLLQRTRARLDLLTFVFFVIYMLTLIWVGWSFAWDSVQQRETAGTPWNPPIYPVKLAIPLAGLPVLLQGLADVVSDFYAARGETRP